jgi:hypothetical protein
MDDKDLSIQEEAGLPENWQPIDVEPIRPGRITQPITGPASNEDKNAFHQGTAPSNLQHDSTFVGTQYGTPGVVNTPLMPLGANGNPITNAAIQSTATKAAASVPAQTVKISLVAPQEIVVTGSPASATGTFTLAWATELPNTVFAGPSAAFRGQDTVVEANDFHPAFSISGTGQTNNDLVILLTAQNFDTSSHVVSLSSPWSTLVGNGSIYDMVFQATAGAAGDVLTASDNLSSTAAWAAMMIFVSSGVGVGTTPVVNQTVTQTGGNSGSLNLTGVAAGDVILVTGNSSRPFGGFFLAVSDDKGNQYNEVGRAINGTTGGAQVIAYATTVVVGGTVNVSFVSDNVSVQGGSWSAILIRGVGSVPGVPSFRALVPLDLPAVSLTHPGNGGVFGILPLANGGTGADLSAAGGTSFFLKQNGVGAAVTSVRPVYNDLAGLVSVYNGGTLVSNGFPGIIADVTRGGLASDIIPTNLVASTPGFAGTMFRISYYMVVNVPAGTSSTLPDLSFTWHDDTGVLQSASFQAAVPTANTGTTLLSGTLITWAAAGTAIQYQTGGTLPYQSVGSPAMTFNVRIKVEQL